VQRVAPVQVLIHGQQVLVAELVLPPHDRLRVTAGGLAHHLDRLARPGHRVRSVAPDLGLQGATVPWVDQPGLLHRLTCPKGEIRSLHRATVGVEVLEQETGVQRVRGELDELRLQGRITQSGRGRNRERAVPGRSGGRQQRHAAQRGRTGARPGQFQEVSTCQCHRGLLAASRCDASDRRGRATVTTAVEVARARSRTLAAVRAPPWPYPHGPYRHPPSDWRYWHHCGKSHNPYGTIGPYMRSDDVQAPDGTRLITRARRARPSSARPWTRRPKRSRPTPLKSWKASLRLGLPQRPQSR
jgi:hypothetical protein